jgi:hypothetical protein
MCICICRRKYRTGVEQMPNYPRHGTGGLWSTVISGRACFKGGFRGIGEGDEMR